MENNPGHAKRVLLIEQTLATGATIESEVFPLYYYDIIGGTLHANQVVTLTAYQGPSSTHPKYLDRGDSLVHLGDGNIGQASRLNFEVFSAEGFGQIRISNASGATATIRCAVELRVK